MAFQHLRAVLLVEPGMADNGGRHAVRFGDAVHPDRLLDLEAPVAFRLDMDGRDDIVAGGVAAIVRRQVVPPERRIVAEEETAMRLRAVEPGIAKRVQVPEMVVGVDDRQVGVGHGGLRTAGGGAYPAASPDGAKGRRCP